MRNPNGLQELERMLNANFKALGFSMVDLELLNIPESHYSIIRCLVTCPCGGKEYVNMIIDTIHLNVQDTAKVILSGTCNREHFLEDVTKGTLPPFDVDKHVFKTLILSDEIS